jgi:hypothetical protein
LTEANDTTGAGVGTGATGKNDAIDVIDANDKNTSEVKR